MNAVTVSALVERAMVMNLSIGMWQGYRLDREASRKVTTQANADADAARVNKHLIPKALLAPVVTAANSVRTHFYANTLPWRDNGDRLMTKKLYLKFVPEHQELVKAFNEEVGTFIDTSYPVAVEQAEFRMGELFRHDDYPTPDQLRRRFYINLDIDALTTSGDFRVAIDEEHADRIRARMEKAAEQRVQTAMTDVWKRIADTVGRMHERLSSPKAVFHQTTISNVEELAEMLPGLNVMDDPKIEQIREMIVGRLVGVDVKAARADTDYRKAIASDAQVVLDRVAHITKALGGAGA